MKTKTYKIPQINYAHFVDQIERLNRKARKIGCPEIKVRELESYTVTSKEGTKARRYFEVEVSGETPQYNGWTFIASLQHLPADNDKERMLIRSIPGENIPEEYHNRGRVCDHCNQKRYRKDTYIVRHTDGTHKQVGSTCIKDFLGHNNPHLLATWAETILSADDIATSCEDPDLFGGSRGNSWNLFTLDKYLETVAAIIRVQGWVSRGKAYDYGMYATADLAYDIAYRGWNKPNRAVEVEKKIGQPTVEDIETTQKAIEWAKNFSQKELINDYLFNINTIAESGLVNASMIGYAASIVSSYLRTLVQTKTKKNFTESKYISTVGEKDTFTLELLKTVPIDGYRYSSVLHIFKDNKGNRLVWFSSSKTLEEDKTYNVKATVKAHSEYKGIKQTVLTRIKELTS